MKPLLFLTFVLLLSASYVGMTWRTVQQQRVNGDLIAAIKRLDADGTAAALQHGADPNTLSSPKATSRLVQWLKPWLRSDAAATTDDETPLNEALLAYPYGQTRSARGMHSDADDAKRTRVVQILLKAGANSHTLYRSGQEPLVVASGSCPADVVRLLLDRHADVNATNPNGTSALMNAALYDRAGTARMLLKYGADIDHRNSQGLTALMCASANDYVATETVLLNSHANVSFADAQGRTALKYATLGGYNTSLHLLQQHGATK